MSDKPLPPICTIVYTHVLGMLRDRAKELGYCLAIHGSMARDLDIVAVPWVESAVSAEELIEAMRVIVDGMIHPTGTMGGRLDPVTKQFVPAVIENPSIKPHGRLAWNIHLGGGPFLDISVMPRTIATLHPDTEEGIGYVGEVIGIGVSDGPTIPEALRNLADAVDDWTEAKAAMMTPGTQLESPQ